MQSKQQESFFKQALCIIPFFWTEEQFIRFKPSTVPSVCLSLPYKDTIGINSFVGGTLNHCEQSGLCHKKNIVLQTSIFSFSNINNFLWVS